MVKKQTSKKSTTLKPIIEKVVEQKKPDPTGYVVPVSFKREPVNKNEPVADIFWNRSTNLITLQCHAPQHEAHIEMIVEGDISIETNGNISMVSQADNPEEWVKNLVNSREFSGNPFIAFEAQGIYEA